MLPPPQATLPAVHCPRLPPPCPPGQQACPAPPHVPQLPVVHVPPMTGHAEAAAVQFPFTQQPFPQPLASQHASPGAPHCAHSPPLQAYPDGQDCPAQQASPAPPHAAHTPRVHTAPDPHSPPAQHAAPGSALQEPPGPPPVVPLVPPQQRMTAAVINDQKSPRMCVSSPTGKP